MYHIIINPVNNKKINILSREGKHILKMYLHKFIQGGYYPTGEATSAEAAYTDVSQEAFPDSFFWNEKNQLEVYCPPNNFCDWSEINTTTTTPS